MLFILFVKQKMRRSLVWKMPWPETRFAPDGLRYSWAEFKNYFDAETAGATSMPSPIALSAETVALKPCSRISRKLI